MPRQLPLPAQKHTALAMATGSCPHLPGWKAWEPEDRRLELSRARRVVRNLARLGFEIVPVKTVRVKRRRR